MYSTFNRVYRVVHSRGVVPGGAVGAIAPPHFGRSLNPISTRGVGGDYAHQIKMAPPSFSDLPTALHRF